MLLIATFMFEPAKLQTNCARARGISMLFGVTATPRSVVPSVIVHAPVDFAEGSSPPHAQHGRMRAPSDHRDRGHGPLRHPSAGARFQRCTLGHSWAAQALGGLPIPSLRCRCPARSAGL